MPPWLKQKQTKHYLFFIKLLSLVSSFILFGQRQKAFWSRIIIIILRKYSHLTSCLYLCKDLWIWISLNIWTEYMGDSKTLIALLITNIFLIFFMKLFFYAFKSWGHGPICPFLSSLKNKFQWTQNSFWSFIRKVLIWSFLDNSSLWSKKSTPIQPRGVIGAPPLCIFKRWYSWECSVCFFRGPWIIGTGNP